MQARLTTKPEQHVIAAIQALDLESVKLKVMDAELGEGWTREYADSIEAAYKNYLTMLAKYPDDIEDILISKDVDELWHAHILHTKKYADDCQKIFGNFLHHDPQPRERSSADIQKRSALVEKTRRLYQQESGNGRNADAAYCNAAVRADKVAYCNAAVRANDVSYCNATLRAGNTAYCNATVPADKAAYCNAAVRAGDVSYCNATLRAENAAYCNAAIRAGKVAYCNATVRTGEDAYCNATVQVGNVAYCNATVQADNMAYCNASVRTNNAAYCNATIRTGDVAYCNAGIRSGNIAWSGRTPRPMSAKLDDSARTSLTVAA